MQPSLQATGDEAEEEGERAGGRERESTRTVLFLLVCKQCSIHGLYVYSVCVFVCQECAENKALTVCSKNTTH